MENTADGGRVGGKSRKRKRQVSWAAAELLEEVSKWNVWHVTAVVSFLFVHPCFVSFSPHIFQNSMRR